MGNSIRVYCAAIADNKYGGHEFSSSKWVPWAEGVHHPPTCHGKPMLTNGALNMALLEKRIRESGLVVECRLNGGLEQSAWCHSHGWSGTWNDMPERDRCPRQRFAAWIARKHEFFAVQVA